MVRKVSLVEKQRVFTHFMDFALKLFRDFWKNWEKWEDVSDSVAMVKVNPPRFQKITLDLDLAAAVVGMIPWGSYALPGSCCSVHMGIF